MQAVAHRSRIGAGKAWLLVTAAWLLLSQIVISNAIRGGSLFGEKFTEFNCSGAHAGQGGWLTAIEPGLE